MKWTLPVTRAVSCMPLSPDPLAVQGAKMGDMPSSSKSKNSAWADRAKRGTALREMRLEREDEML